MTYWAVVTAIDTCLASGVPAKALEKMRHLVAALEIVVFA